ncbi:MAG: hypothetical protein AAGH90_01980 [Pseudomonadota bacterium]
MLGLKSTLFAMGAAVAILSACGSSPSTDTSTNASVASDRPTLEELKADYAEALAKAQETTGPGNPALWSLRDEDTKI